MTVVAFLALGLAAGLLAATLGVGGGIVYVPALVALFSFSQHEAQGTSLAIIVPTTLVAAAVHARARKIDWRTVAVLGVGGVVGGVIGASSALALDDTLLRRLFAAFLVVMAVRMLRKTRAREHPALEVD